MDKKKLVNFISKYALGGLVSAVKIKIQDKKLATSFATEDRMILGYVIAKDIDLQDCELGIFNTPTLSKLLGALDSDIDVKLVSTSNKFVSINLKDKSLSATFMLSDLNVIPSAPEIKQLPPTTFDFEINSEFISKLSSAKSALNDATSFSFVQEGTEIKLIVNYELRNTDRISLDLGVEYADSLPIISFDINKFLAILNANKDAISGKVSVSEQGLLTITFIGDVIQSKYYLVMLQSN